MKLVRENISFKRDLNPRSGIGIGSEQLIIDYFKRKWYSEGDFPLYLVFFRDHNSGWYSPYKTKIEGKKWIKRFKTTKTSQDAFLSYCPTPWIAYTMLKDTLGFDILKKMHENVAFKRDIDPKEALKIGNYKNINVGDEIEFIDEDPGSGFEFKRRGTVTKVNIKPFVHYEIITSDGWAITVPIEDAELIKE